MTTATNSANILVIGLTTMRSSLRPIINSTIIHPRIDIDAVFVQKKSRMTMPKPKTKKNAMPPRLGVFDECELLSFGDTISSLKVTTRIILGIT